MIRKYPNHKLQIHPWHPEVVSHNNHQISGRQFKQSNELYLPHQDDCKIRMDIKKRITKQRTITESNNGSNNQQRFNNNFTALKRTAAYATVGLKCIFYWYQIFALDSAIVEAQTC